MYSGFLEWHDERSDIEVIRLIFRDNGIQFHFMTPWGDAAETYSLEGFAKSMGDGKFASEILACVDRTGYRFPPSTKIHIHVREVSPTELSIAGIWYEVPGRLDDEKYEFTGLLQRVERLQVKSAEPFPNRPPIPLGRSPR